MFKNLNRGISTPIAIGIIAVLVVLVGGGILAYQYYYIPKQQGETPETKTSNGENNYEKIAGDLMQNYLEQYKSVNVVQNKRLASYKINKIDVGSFDDKDQCFRFTVDFSVETAIKPVEGNMVKSDWVAGNGSVGSGNWINNKSLVFSVLKENGNYRLIDSGTGGGGGSCAIPGKYFSAVLKETDILKDGTVNWRTYRNTEYGFEFKYPSDWEFKNDHFIKNVYEKDFSCSDFYGTCTSPEISIVVQPYKSVESYWLWEIIENKSGLNPPLKMPFDEEVKKQTVLIAGRKITKIDMTDPNTTNFSDPNARSFYYIFDSKEINSLIIFHTYTNNKELTSYLSVIEGMISTFKFTE